MSDVGKTNIVVMWTVGPDDVPEGDRIFESHVDWQLSRPGGLADDLGGDQCAAASGSSSWGA
jgi:hypothetical protein